MDSIASTEISDQWMEAALNQAKDALNSGEVPVGCVFIYKGAILASGRNTVNETRNATRHAEMNCVDQVLKRCQDKKLNPIHIFPEIIIYVTVEPCGMCADALGQLEVKQIVFGCSNDRFGGCGSVVDVPKMYSYPYNIIKGIRADEAIGLLKDFYKGENPNAPSDKAKRKKTQ